MKLIMMSVFVISILLILFIVFKKKLGFKWLSILGIHMVLAAVGLYGVNFSGIIPNIYIPLNPVTIGTVVLLGLPGVALLAGLKMTL